jgi:hypothetical protein
MAVLKSEQSHGAPDRRGSRRRPLTELLGVTDVTVQSQKVHVIDAASGGVLIQSPLRLSPGSQARVEIARTDSLFKVGGRVVRSEVAGVSNGRIEYRSAIAFDRHVDFTDERFGENLTLALTGNLGDFVVLFDADGLEHEHAALNGW